MGTAESGGEGAGQADGVGGADGGGTAVGDRPRFLLPWEPHRRGDILLDPSDEHPLYSCATVDEPEVVLPWDNAPIVACRADGTHWVTKGSRVQGRQVQAGVSGVRAEEGEPLMGPLEEPIRMPKPGNGVVSKQLPGTWFAGMPDGSTLRGVSHPDVLMAHALRLQGAVDEVRVLLGENAPVAVRDADVAEAFLRWGI